jgi:putative colanic acid biosynthesis acetyltransferase WcaF
MALLDAKTTNPREGGASFSMAHRLKRLAFQFTWSLLCRWTPVAAHSWRRTILRCFGARISPTAKVYPSVRIWYPQNLEMASYSCLAPEVNCYSMAPITLDAYALVSQGAYLCAGTHDVDDRHFQLVVKPIVIKANAWVAAEAFVGPGVTIGQGAVLGARAVAFRDLEPDTIYIGNPAKPLRKRKVSGGAL